MSLRSIQVALVVVLLFACQNNDGNEAGACDPGSQYCECVQGQLCLGILECNAGICVAPGGTGDPGDGDPGDGDPGDGDGESCGSGELLCNGSCADVMTDDDNCGSCGNTCDIAKTGGLGDGIGGCASGVCEPTWSECIPFEAPIKSCNEVCGESGQSCVADSCQTDTFVEYVGLNQCYDFFEGWGVNGDCSGPTFPLDGQSYYRCCCQ